ncbi:hypothetical protein PSACC_02302 [Paramicrosporidium saccamoebae]|uniref:Uncharacterized protein n=1 Tax=Paramicrosporidium saccamoebae TaxID=1246581 RepID=A0A2H9TJE7_9FUNG|nr:hypothetical protein PSACC_02302 [Paramicrosporidium saccamoebae]
MATFSQQYDTGRLGNTIATDPADAFILLLCPLHWNELLCIAAEGALLGSQNALSTLGPGVWTFVRFTPEEVRSKSTTRFRCSSS